VIVQTPALGLKPEPVNVTAVGDDALVGVRTILGKTVNTAVAELAALSVPVTTMPTTYVEPAPTVNAAVRTPPALTEHACVITMTKLELAGVTVHDPAVNPVPETVTAVPVRTPSGGEPLAGLSTSVGAAATLGVARKETETNNAEVSSSIMNRELELRVVNLETHGNDVVSREYLMLQILAIWAVSTN